MFTSFKDDLDYIWKKFSSFTCPADTGLDYASVKKRIAEMSADAELGALPRPVHKAKIFQFVTRNLRIDVNPHDFFPTFDCWDRNDRPLTAFVNFFQQKIRRENLTQAALWDKMNISGAGNSWIDFDHSVPDWLAILPLGFPGIRSRAQEARKTLAAKQPLTPKQEAYYDGIDITYDAMLEMLARFRNYARSHANGSQRVLYVADALEKLRTAAPSNTYEVLLFIYMYFMFSEHIDRFQVRSLGNLDNMLLPYVENDLKNGTFTEEQIRVLFDYFLMQYGSINNYWGHPFYLGGTNPDGSSRINRLSYLILEEFDKLAIPTPKIQLKIAKTTPDEFIDTALRMIRKGHSSLVFCGEQGMGRIMKSMGATDEDARNCLISGCYEFAPSGRYNANGTCGGHVNMLKPFEWIFNDGVDSRTKSAMGDRLMKLEDICSFDDFYRCYLANLKWSVNSLINVANDFEQYIADINPSNVFSATISLSIERALDGFFNGCYINSTSLLQTGLGTAVDALMAVKEFVFDKQEISLVELRNALNNNWQGHEKLREKILRSPKKYGNGLPDVDQYAVRISQFLGYLINGRPNARGGNWRASGHCAKQYFVLGEKTMATPDGRLNGEEMSKNLSPTMGMDRRGLTALIRSVTSIDSLLYPDDYPLDVMLHPATVQGDEGLSVWRSLLRMYLDSNGLAIHFNVFDAETLKAAQREPEKYSGLQIRVCGWNVRFTTMAPVEQDMYIRRAENIME